MHNSNSNHTNINQLPPIIRHLGCVTFEDSWQQMQEFTQGRTAATPDEFWIIEHPAVFTLGLAGKEEHFLFKNHSIPIVRCDRGGQVTFHGPGQIIIYTMIDMQRAQLNVRSLVERIECGVINYLSSLGIKANGNREAPGVYVDGKKIASLGLKIKKNGTYHGVSFNFAMDLTPFSYINVCGYSGLKVTQLSDLVQQLPSQQEAGTALAESITTAVFATLNVESSTSS